MNKRVSQSCAVTKSETFWRAAGQSNLVYKRLTATKACNVWFSYSHNYTAASGAVFRSVCQVWLSSGPPEFSAFIYCAWLWNRLRGRWVDRQTPSINLLFQIVQGAKSVFLFVSLCASEYPKLSQTHHKRADVNLHRASTVDCGRRWWNPRARRWTCARTRLAFLPHNRL